MSLRHMLLVGCASIFLFPQGTHAFFPQGARTTQSLRMHSLPVGIESIAPGATHVPLLKLRLQAPCESNVQIDSLDVQLMGMGDARSIEGVYIEKDAVRISRRIAFSSADRTATLRPRRLVIGACSSETIEIAADFSQTAAIGGEFALRIVSAREVRTNDSLVTGPFPISTNGTVTLEVVANSAGAVEATFLSPPEYVPIRENALAKFHLEAVAGPYQCLQSITLTNEGTARNDEMRDLYIARSDNEPLTNIAPVMDRDRVTLEFLVPYCLEEKKPQLFQLRGRAYTRKETNDFILEEPSDVYAIPVWRLPR